MKRCAPLHWYWDRCRPLFGRLVEDWRIGGLVVALGHRSLAEQYLEKLGNWRSPLFEECGGVLQTLLAQAACREMVVAHVDQRGALYDFVVWSRIDFLWVAVHPPIHRHHGNPQLERIVWIPK